jgi:hypothetical protein
MSILAEIPFSLLELAPIPPCQTPYMTVCVMPNTPNALV